MARAALRDLEEKGVIKKVVGHARMSVYSKSISRICSPLERVRIDKFVLSSTRGWGRRRVNGKNGWKASCGFRVRIIFYESLRHYKSFAPFMPVDCHWCMCYVLMPFSDIP